MAHGVFRRWHRLRQRSRNRIQHIAALLFVVLGAAAWTGVDPAAAAPPAGGLSSEWASAEGEHLRYFVQGADQAGAEQFAFEHGPDAERAVQELGLLFEVTLPARVALYAYSDRTAFDLAVAATGRWESEGVAAFADPATNDISIYAPAFAGLSAIETENALRHALSHVFTAIASGGNMPTGFDEGLALYVERPVNEKIHRIAASVQAALQRGDMPQWWDMNRDPQLTDPDLVPAESYAAIAFLIDRYDLAPLRQFMIELRTATSWTEAMRAAYGRSEPDIEKQWKDDLPRWVTSGWRTNVVASFDLEPAKKFLAQANYAAAKAAFEPSQALYRQLDSPEQLAAIETLIAQCDIGIQAEALMTQAQQALELHTYDRAVSLLKQARDQYGQLSGGQAPTTLLDTYDALALAGLEAGEQLDQAVQLSHSWLDYRRAQSSALSAGTTYSRLGDAEGQERADTVLSDLNNRQRRIVLLLGALTVLTLAWLALWLWARGQSELDWR